MPNSIIPPDSIKAAIERDLFTDGESAKVHILRNHHGMTATFMDIGATWLSCQLPTPSGQREVLLGMTSLRDYQSHSAFLGATIGRFANRIAKGQFSLNGQTYSITRNDNDNSLHGGIEGFDKRRWLVKAKSDSHITYCLMSPDGDQGFPGNLTAEVAYTLTENNQLCIEYSAICDQDCPINLTNHAYFNLDGAESGKTILDHELQLRSNEYLPTDEELIPTGKLKAVQESSFDFNTAQRIGARLLEDEDQKLAKGYDHAFTLPEELTDGASTIARLISSDKQVVMSVFTDKPAIQFYSGNFLAGTPSRTGEYQDYQGLALETQFLPDCPNHPEWPEANKRFITQKSFYQHQTSYQFTTHHGK
ncbi:galactose-1-epimerase [Vibrio parahaemolyticus]|uniref:galactose-1-epimerase n=1 Tax=Vibrio parahaemolyticus TaxID=670 RepID=UPI001EFED110|nr:galactose-1-epimerase [Vibrio parahaemolyticus]MCG9633957.1 galactose-1-epimerase [Vibrio parahaemolyticus]